MRPWLLAAFLCLLPPEPATAGSASAGAELAGLWVAKHDYGPGARGALVLQKTASGWQADFRGRRIPVDEADGVLSFEMPNGEGGFRAKLQPDGGIQHAQWFQPASPANPPFGSGISFEPDGPARWRGEVLPMYDTSTAYLMVQERPDGSLGAFLRHREFNLGVRYNLDRLVRDGNSVQVTGRYRGEDSDRVLLKGSFDPDDEILTLAFDPPIDGNYDFRRAGDESDFYPRDRIPGRYAYQPPLERADGWPVATLDEVDIDRDGIEAFVQWILDMPMDSVESMQVDAILVARHGKLVLEEYFHGFDRDTPHPTRSAAKSLTATLVGAAMQAGLPVSLSTPVYAVMNGGSVPEGLEPRKRAMRLEHLLTMTSGTFCDDGNPDAPGNEETMTSQSEEPDLYRFYMRAPMDREPGAEAVYCSGDPNLAIGVLHRATGEHPMDLFDRLLGQPLQIARHIWYLSPSRQPYGGGSTNMIPRDFMKLGQLMLNEGTWNGRRVLSEDFVRRASSPLVELNGIQYGYLWWGVDFPFKDRTVHAYFAGGNGGQGILVVPALDLVVATFGSNYASRSGLEIQQGLTPRSILPAVREAGDAKGTPVVPREYKVIYGRKPRPAASPTSR
jgi:CubicO group peptidase (beta-lactamase class C family)